MTKNSKKEQKWKLNDGENHLKFKINRNLKKFGTECLIYLTHCFKWAQLIGEIHTVLCLYIMIMDLITKLIMIKFRELSLLSTHGNKNCSRKKTFFQSVSWHSLSCIGVLKLIQFPKMRNNLLRNQRRTIERNQTQCCNAVPAKMVPHKLGQFFALGRFKHCRIQTLKCSEILFEM